MCNAENQNKLDIVGKWLLFRKIITKYERTIKAIQNY